MLPSRYFLLSAIFSVALSVVEIEVLRRWGKFPMLRFVSPHILGLTMIAGFLGYLVYRYPALAKLDRLVSETGDAALDDSILRDPLWDPARHGFLMSAIYLVAHLPLVVGYVFANHYVLTIVATGVSATVGAIVSGLASWYLARAAQHRMLGAAFSRTGEIVNTALWGLGTRLMWYLGMLFVGVTAGWAAFSYYALTSAAQSQESLALLAIIRVGAVSTLFLGCTLLGTFLILRGTLNPLKQFLDGTGSPSASPSGLLRSALSSRELLQLNVRFGATLERLKEVESDRQTLNEQVDALIERSVQTLRQSASVATQERDDLLADLNRLEEANDRNGQLVAEQLARIQQLRGLASYVPEEVMRSLERNDGEHRIERKRITAFFSDIVGFTATADRLEPEQLVRVLNRYFDAMTEIARRHGGTLDKFIGDALLIFFVHDRFSDDREAACRCVAMAFEMQSELAALWSDWKGEGLDAPLQIRIGINTGYATVGDVGSESRRQYTAIGNQVNIASRIESSADIGEIWISHATKALVEHHFGTESRGVIQLKGIHYPLEVFAVSAARFGGDGPVGPAKAI